MDKKLDSFEDRLAKGLSYADMLGFTNQNEIEQNKVLINSLVEVLIGKGVIRLDEIDKRKDSLTKYFAENRTGPMVNLLETPDKYEEKNNIQIDCENRLHLCKGSCCRLSFALSTQDLNEGVVRWNYTEPYVIAKKEDGYCHHCDENKQCTIYNQRPIICRTYDCRNDARIWEDFENKIPNPDLDKPNWPNI
jgi:Fe-S-cluster containining protein